jgi:hypothetical protein
MNQESKKCPFPFLSEYKDIFGKPREGIHSYRFMNISIVDSVTTVILGLLISFVFNVDLLPCLFVTFIVGEVLHYIFCVDTQIILLTKKFFKN